MVPPVQLTNFNIAQLAEFLINGGGASVYSMFLEKFVSPLAGSDDWRVHWAINVMISQIIEYAGKAGLDSLPRLMGYWEHIFSFPNATLRYAVLTCIGQ